MKFISTNNRSTTNSFEEAMFKGMADDGGLFLPEKIPSLPASIIHRKKQPSLTEIAFQVSKCFLQEEINDRDLLELSENAFPFDAPLKELAQNLYTLELFHGPTLAFKDFGARYMASLFEFFLSKRAKELTVLVATSGDTGSAVAQAFYNKAGINVVILYPSKKVSLIQEKQLTTLGGNVKALEVEGTFDDCQRMVKEAFVDSDITSKVELTSANSINIARLIPQSFYYISAYHQLPSNSPEPVFSVPSGNFGNLTAGIIAKIMGLPIKHFIASTNANDIIPIYLNSGKYVPRPSISTISNAMDVGNPSNFARLKYLFKDSREELNKIVSGYGFSDQETRHAIKEIYDKYDYISDPHGAIGYLGLKKYLQANNMQPLSCIYLGTAHSAKFSDVVEEVCGNKIEFPASLSETMKMEKKSIYIKANLSSLKEILI